MHRFEKRPGRNFGRRRQPMRRALVPASALDGVTAERLEEDEAVVMLREVAEQTMRLIDGASGQRPFVILPKQHLVARLRDRCNELCAKLFATQTLDQSNHE